LLDELDHFAPDITGTIAPRTPIRTRIQPEAGSIPFRRGASCGARAPHLRGLTERLYLSVSDDVRAIVAPGLDISGGVGRRHPAVEFYIDGEDCTPLRGAAFCHCRRAAATLHAVER